jgi:creatinine amidohydrolase
LTGRLWLAELTTDELAAALAGGTTVALLPVGSTEPHGPHLPLATDAILSEEVCLRAARALRDQGIFAAVAPTIPYGVTRYARGFRGALSLREETLVALLTDVIRALLDDGFAHVALVNNHLEPEHAAALRRAVEQLADERGDAAVSFPDQLTRRWGRTLTDEFKRGDCHAGRYETSLVQAARPGLVRPGSGSLPTLTLSLAAAIRAAEGREVTFAGIGMDRAYTGAPAEATPGEGEATYERLVTMVVTEILERLPPAPRETP